MDSEREPVRLVIVEDDQPVRLALRLVIYGEPDLTVVAEAADRDAAITVVGDAAITVVDEQRPDVVLMDVRMPGRDGLSTTRELLTRPTPPRVFMLTTFDSDDLVLGALRAGALGFVLKGTPPARILDAVRTVADGLGNPEIAERLHISIATVKAHTGNLFAKLAVDNRVQIALLVRDAAE